MEFLDSFLLPLSTSNLALYQVLLTISMCIFLIYSGLLLGSAILSLFYANKTKYKNQNKYAKLSAYYINIPLFDIWFALIFAIVPFLAVLIFYYQFFHNETTQIIKLIVFSFGFYLLGFAFLISHRMILKSRNVYKILKGEKVETEEGELLEIDSKVLFPGVVMLFLALWMFVGTISLTLDYNAWVGSDSIFGVLFRVQSLILFFQFFALSMSFATVIFLVKECSSNKRIISSTDNLTRQSAGISVIFASIIPVFFFFDAVFTPVFTISAIPFVLILIAIVLLFVFVHFIYVNLRWGDRNYTKPAFYLLLIVFLLFIIQGQLSFDTATKEQRLKLTTEQAQQK